MFTSDLQTRVLERLGEDPNSPVYYTAANALSWLNAAQRLFVLLTLCLETTNTLQLAGGAAFYSMLTIAAFQDWLLPLRVRITGGAKLNPARLAELAALDAAWSVSPGAPTRYALLGFDLLGIYQQPPAGVAMSLQITYARCPDPLLGGFNESPEIPAEFHPALADWAIPLMRAREGGQDFQKVLPLWDRGLDAATKLADYVRARNKEQGYDYMPVELRRIDRSKMLQGAVKQ